MITFQTIGLFVLAYLLGSIPTSVWVGRKFFDLDVREYGSKNAGATNTIRVLGFKYGFGVLLVDLLKAFVAVRLGLLVNNPEFSAEQMINFQILLGIAAVLGHIFPIFASFKGGKGVASLFGVLFGLIPLIFIILVGVFLIIFISTRLVSLGSIICALLLPVFVFIILPTPFLSIKIFALIIAVLVPLTHHKNIRRLLLGKEKKLNLKSKFKAQESDEIS